MKKFLFHSPIALVAFFVGIFIAGIWILYNQNLNVSVPKSEELWNSGNIYDSQIPKTEKIFREKEILKRFDEMPLTKIADLNYEIYRMILLPTFDAPIMIKIWRTDNQYFMVTKKADGVAGFGLERFGKKIYEKKQPLTEEEWNGFIKTVEKSMFWQSPSKIDEMPINDGATWFMEGKTGNRFQEVDRISPTADLKECFFYLLRLSGFESDYSGY